MICSGEIRWQKPFFIELMRRYIEIDIGKISIRIIEIYVVPGKCSNDDEYNWL